VWNLEKRDKIICLFRPFGLYFRRSEWKFASVKKEGDLPCLWATVMLDLIDCYWL